MTAPLAVVTDFDPLTDEWWRDRLYGRLEARRDQLSDFDDWYTGQHPAPQAYERAREVLWRLLDLANANYLRLLVNAAHERLAVEGVRAGGRILDVPWSIWQGNNFDGASSMVMLESLVMGNAAVLVSPEVNANGFPTITPEHPQQTIVEYEPGSLMVRAAGLKVWVDDRPSPNLLMSTLYLPDRIVTWAAEVRAYVGTAAQQQRWGAADRTYHTSTPRPQWEPFDDGPNDLGEVPLVDFPNMPRMLHPAVSEFAPVIPIQRSINKTLLDRHVNQEFGAFKQKWVTGYEVPIDPATGHPVETFKAAIDHALVAPDPDTKFGQFNPEDVGPLLSAVKHDVEAMAAIVPTPPHYLLGAMVNLSAEALKASEAALVSRIRSHQRHFDDPLESVMRLALKAAGQSVPNASGMQTIWRNPEFRTEGELVDALVKMSSLGVPREALWERWGATPQEITRWKAMEPPPISASLVKVSESLASGTPLAPGTAPVAPAPPVAAP